MGNPTQSYNPEVWGGIECTINRVKDSFFDQLIYSGHYDRDNDIELIAGLQIKKIRYPILWEKHQPTIDHHIDWSVTEKKLQKLQQKNIEVIAGLVHHGSGPAFTHLLDNDFPYLLAQYAQKVAEKFPWIQYYTPVNEPLTTARFSGLYGLWYPHKKSDKSFAKMLLNELKGTVLVMQEIRKINPQAKLVQTEDLGKTYSTKKLKYQADFENARRWLTYDILCGSLDEQHPLWKYFIDLGIEEEELLFFQKNICIPDVFGFNHYVTSERFLDERQHLYPAHTHGGNLFHRYADVEAVRVEIEGETGLEILLQEAWQRYQKPMAITEVHLHCYREEQLRWFKHVWNTCTNLKAKGVNIQAVTAWAMLGSFGWDTLLTKPAGSYEPGVFDLRGGMPRPTALAVFIKQLTNAPQSFHPVSVNNGWWHRNNRFFYPSKILNIQQEHLLLSAIRPVVIIGKTGTLGKAFARLCQERSIQYVLLGRQDCDIADEQAIESVIDIYKPWAVINAAGYVRVDEAESEVETCFRENVFGPNNLALACQRHGIKLLTFSSDLVFDGQKKTPYLESDAIHPLNTYGKSKAQCEEMVLHHDPSSLIVRTSAFFSPWDEYNFLHGVIDQLSKQQQVLVASDVYISPTYVPDLVHTALDLLIDDEAGIWHLANKGKITWAELAVETAKSVGLSKEFINAMPADELSLEAPRPKYSVLGSEKAILLPTLENALQRFFDEKKVAVSVV